ERIVRAKMLAAVAGIGSRLKRQGQDEITFVEQLDAITHVLVVHTLGHGRDDRRAYPRAFQVVQRLLFGGALITAAAQHPERGIAERVELQADVHVALRELFAERVVGGDAKPIRGNRDARDLLLGTRHVQKLHELRMQRGLAPGQIDGLERALFVHQAIEDFAELLAGHVVIVPILHDADRALEVTVVGDLDDRQARVLLVIWAKSAVVRAAFFDLRRMLEWDRPFFDVGQRTQEPISITGDHRFALAVRRALFAQVNLALAQQAHAVYRLSALWAQPARERVKHLTRADVGGAREFGIEQRKLQHVSYLTSGSDRGPVADGRARLMSCSASGLAKRASFSR